MVSIHSQLLFLVIQPKVKD